MKYPPVLQTLVAATVAWALAHFVPVWGFGGATIVFVSWIIAVVGIGFLVAALNLFRRHKTTFDPLDPAKAQNLVVTGIYKITRNPMYVGMALVLVAWCLVLGDIIAFLTLPAFVLAINELQIKGEERALLAKFGDDYAVYKTRVRRWL